MGNWLRVNRDGMSLIEKCLLEGNYPEEVSDYKAEMMLHALGSDNRPYTTYKGQKTFHAYRNYYDAGGHDAEEWNDLVSKGYATKKANGMYHVTVKGIRVLEFLTQCRIWDNYLCVADCWNAVLIEMMKDDVFCGYGCWLPTTSRELSFRLAIPQKLVLKTLRSLEYGGYVMKGHFGGQDEDGYVHCKHGWYLTKHAQEQFAEKYEEIKKDEYKRMAEIDKEVTDERTD